LFCLLIVLLSVPEYEIVQIHSVRHKRSASGLDDIHRVNLATHGRQLRLELRPNHHLVSRHRDLDLWYADAFPTNVSYSPVIKVIIFYNTVSNKIIYRILYLYAAKKYGSKYTYLLHKGPKHFGTNFFLSKIKKISKIKLPLF
jgi:hypothetical protein